MGGVFGSKQARSCGDDSSFRFPAGVKRSLSLYRRSRLALEPTMCRE